MFTIQSKDPAILRGEKDGSYRSAMGLSQSAFSNFFISPKHYINGVENPIKATPDMEFGTCFHSLMLDAEPCYAVKKKVDGRTAEGKKYNADFAAENAGKIIIDEEQEIHLNGMRESVMTQGGLASELYKNTKDRELCLFATALLDGGEIRMKGMLDGYDAATGTIWDFKKCGKSADKESFTKMVRDRMYWVQAVHYWWLGVQNGLDVQRVVYIPVEDKPPYALATYTFDITKKMKYHKHSPLQIWERGLDDFLHCQKTGDWHGYPAVLQEIEL